MAAQSAPVAIIGAGFAGLVAARELARRGIPFTVYEAGKELAGLAKTFRDDEGFSYDVGAHFITNRLAEEVGVADACRLVRYYGETAIVDGRAYSYPFGLLRSPRFLASGIKARVSALTAHRAPRTAADWFRAAYGTALADEVALPLLEAWSGAPATELAPSVGEKLGGGIASVLYLKLASRVTGRAVASGYCRELPESPRVWHVYPEGGVSLLCERLASEFPAAIRLESPVQRILVEGGRAVAVRVGAEVHEASAVISTAPVHVLARICEGTTALHHLARFRYRPMTFVNLRLTGRNLMPDVVVWTPEPRYPFFRVTEATQSMPWLAPPGKTMLTVDLGCSVGDDIWTMSDENLGELCVGHLEPLVRDVRKRYLGCHVVRTPIAYPVFLNEYESDRRRFEASSGVEGLYSIGSNGEFAHILMEDVYWRTTRRIESLARSIPTSLAHHPRVA